MIQARMAAGKDARWAQSQSAPDQPLLEGQERACHLILKMKQWLQMQRKKRSVKYDVAAAVAQRRRRHLSIASCDAAGVAVVDAEAEHCGNRIQVHLEQLQQRQKLRLHQQQQQQRQQQQQGLMTELSHQAAPGQPVRGHNLIQRFQLMPAVCAKC